MARIRSPNHPAISLPDAIEKVRLIHGNDRQSVLDKEVVAQHMGYGGLNGLSNRLISALVRYGLLEEVNGDRARVSALAMRILFPASEADMATAINEAAFGPPLFAEMREQWPDGVPSDASLRSYLARRNFADDAIDRVMDAYKATVGLVTPSVSSKPIANNTEAEHASARTPAHPAGHGEGSAPVSGPAAIPATGGAHHRPLPGMSRATLPLSEGVAALELPDRLSAESLEDLRDWMEAMLRRAERVVKRTEQAAADEDAMD
jgi:hypothetical protein